MENCSVRKRLVFKFDSTLTCCVSINAKEGDCWIQLSNCVLSLMLHKCHISYQTESTEFYQSEKQFTESTELSRSVKPFAVYTEHSCMSHGELVITEFAR